MKTNKLKTAIFALLWLSAFPLHAQQSYNIYMIEGATCDTTNNVYTWGNPQKITMKMIIKDCEVFVIDMADTHLTLKESFSPITKTDDKGLSYTKYIWSAIDESNRKCQFYKILSDYTTDTIYLLVYKDFAIRYYIKK